MKEYRSLLVECGFSNMMFLPSLGSKVEDRPGHDPRHAIDNTQISQILNWQLAETFEWYLENEKWW